MFLNDAYVDLGFGKKEILFLGIKGGFLLSELVSNGETLTLDKLKLW